jgi:transposase
MVEERKKMELNGLSAPVLGVEERSDEVPSTGASSGRMVPPDPEVVAKPKRRRFTAEYRLRIVEEAELCTEPGDIGRLLRREGLYSSHLTKWREAHRDGALHGLRSKKRGVKSKESNPLEPKVRELEAKITRLEKDLHKAHTILDVQEKVAGLLGFDLQDGKSS